eukprot:CAMPEP_0184335630 /NCGR_PEP_ID=MMETSP1089-20130417/4169_1 /TAXON_ID=38269 ORGANISM="Gloeochaete wittrockiana, Strain SAG46.84" /NCGR_SAMPLE_ID=MMETSP1089 /ASSEMBLY_ACC=CAM_ASM_000445 /LENGTH=555 /DNA_ID=CAMNT_0026660399 /DNA_START=45 /DNA_END=1713 /DNA_ORIENTATION=-
MAQEDSHAFNNIILVSKGPQNTGQFKIHAGGLGWKSKTTGRTVAVSLGEISGMQWMRSFQGYLLRTALKNGTCVRFEGFREQDFNALKEFVQSKYSVDLSLSQISTKGVNWGKTDVEGTMLQFKVDGAESWEVPVSDISNSTCTAKSHEVVLEFHVDDTLQASKEDESLVEMRLYIPPSLEDSTISAAEMFHDKVMKKADIEVSSGDGIAFFDDVPMLTPRGRYRLDLFGTFMKLHGKSYDYKILYTSVSRLFVLPKPDNVHVFVVVSLDPPIRQGQTHYPHLVMQFPQAKDVVEVPLKLSKEQLETKYKDKFSEVVRGYVYDCVSKILKGLTGKKVFSCGSFKSHSQAPCVKCSLKANDGLLYPLEKSFFFLHKPPTYIRHEEVSWIEFSRVNSSTASTVSTSTRNFDVTVQTTSGTAYQFTNMLRNEYKPLFEFLNSKNLKIKNISEMGEEDTARPVDLGGHDDEDEENSEDAEDYNAESDSGGSDAGGSDLADEDEEDPSGSGAVEVEESPVKPKKKPSAENGNKEKKRPTESKTDKSEKKSRADPHTCGRA